MYFREISTIQDVSTKTKPETNLFNGGTTRLLLSSDAAGINKGLLHKHGSMCAVHVIIPQSIINSCIMLAVIAHPPDRL